MIKAVICVFLLCFLSFVAVGEQNPGISGVGVADIKLSFKVDPRVTRGMYMGDRWISPPKYTRVGESKECTIETRAVVVDREGKRLGINPVWVPADAGMLSVTPVKEDEVMITVKRSGESKLKVSAGDLSKELLIKATGNKVIHVEITQ